MVRRRFILLISILLFLVFVLVAFWPGISLSLRQIHVQAVLHEGRNVLRVYVPPGRYVVQVREDVPWSERKASFHVQGTISARGMSLFGKAASGSKQLAEVSEDFDPSSAHREVVVFLEAPRGHLEVSIDYTNKVEGAPVLLCFGPAK